MYLHTSSKLKNMKCTVTTSLRRLHYASFSTCQTQHPEPIMVALLVYHVASGNTTANESPCRHRTSPRLTPTCLHVGFSLLETQLSSLPVSDVCSDEAGPTVQWRTGLSCACLPQSVFHFFFLVAKKEVSLLAGLPTHQLPADTCFPSEQASLCCHAQLASFGAGHKSQSDNAGFRICSQRFPSSCCWRGGRSRVFPGATTRAPLLLLFSTSYF